jgi:hypothetical protein
MQALLLLILFAIIAVFLVVVVSWNIVLAVVVSALFCFIIGYILFG